MKYRVKLMMLDKNKETTFVTIDFKGTKEAINKILLNLASEGFKVIKEEPQK